VPNQDIPIHIIGRRPGEKMYEDILTPLEAAGAKKNGPFYMATSHEVALPELLEQINILRKASQQGSDAMVRSVIQNLIPEFCPDESTQNGSAHANGAKTQMAVEHTTNV
jgi:FlaA1/EpsC-like NDP-sugar epimerase